MTSGSSEISSLISKLSLPQFINRRSLPTFRQTCSFPSQYVPSNINQPSQSSNQPSTVDSNLAKPSQSAKSVSWSELYQDEQLSTSITNHPMATGFLNFYRSVSPTQLPRLVFFGEQHHQPSVLKAQLQALYDYNELCQSASSSTSIDSSTEQTTRRKVYKPNLVLEHFSLLSQSSLSKFYSGEIDFSELNQEYISTSKEGFNLQHYAPLLLLARELDIETWAGFPERPWAREIMREGIESVKELEKSRTATNPNERVSRFTAWDRVENVGQDHRSFLKGLMNPDQPVEFPLLKSDQNDGQTRDQGQEPPSFTHYPTSQIPLPAPESKGFLPAQALKDSFFAHVISEVLKGDNKGKEVKTKGNVASKTDSSNSSPSRPDQEPTAEPIEDAEIVNTVFAVCGSGHCEFGFGTPERCRTMLTEKGLAEIDPVIIVTKPTDSEVWLGPEKYVRDGSEQASNEQENSRWKQSGWGRKLADLVVLYDWID